MGKNVCKKKSSKYQWPWPWSPEDEKVWGALILQKYGEIIDLDRKIQMHADKIHKLKLPDVEYKRGMRRRMGTEPVENAKSPSENTSNSTTSLQGCTVCGVYCKFKCGKCNTVFYCSKDCQVSDWKIHRKVCQMQNNNGQNVPESNQSQQNEKNTDESPEAANSIDEVEDENGDDTYVLLNEREETDKLDEDYVLV